MALFRILWVPLILAGCTEAVYPVLNTGQPYTVYGLLDARADTQAVRVFAVDGTLDKIRPESLGATVMSTELESGLTTLWQEEVVEYEGGRYGHVFWAGFRGEYGKTYRLVLVSPAGTSSSVQVTMPPESEPVHLDPVLGISYAVLPLLWRDAPRLHDIHVSYRTNFGTYDFVYPLHQEARPDGVVMEIKLSADAREIFRALNRARHRIADLRLYEVTVSVLISSSDWVPPGGSYDPDVLIEPGALSNVENGFGFVGAGYDAVLAFDPPDSVKVAAGVPVGGG